jgi:hypothetical protein
MKVGDTLCFAWQDNNTVLALSTIYTIDKAEDFVEKVRKRLAKTLTNGRIVQQVFGDDYAKELQIPCFIDDYNQHIRGVDLANQFRAVYIVHKPTFRTWWPLFYWLIDIACINAYRLYQLTGGKRLLTHLQFKTELYLKLFSYSSKTKL